MITDLGGHASAVFRLKMSTVSTVDQGVADWLEGGGRPWTLVDGDLWVSAPADDFPGPQTLGQAVRVSHSAPEANSSAY